MTINNEILPIELKIPDKSDGPVDLMIIAVLIGADGILAPMTETVEAAQNLLSWENMRLLVLGDFPHETSQRI